MVDLVRPFAGQDRLFRINTGAVFNIEEASGGVGIGAIFLHLSRYEFHLKEVFAVLYEALQAGKSISSVEAKRLVTERIDFDAQNAIELARDLLATWLEGIPKDELSTGGDPAEPHDKGKILHSFLQAGISPDAVRAMSYSDFVAIMRVASEKDVQPPTEDEFDEMIRKYEENLGE